MLTGAVSSCSPNEQTRHELSSSSLLSSAGQGLAAMERARQKLELRDLYQLSSLEELEHEVHVVSETGTRKGLGHQWGA